MRPPQLLAELANLSKSAGENIYKRVAIAEQLITDNAWVDLSFGGNSEDAAYSLENDYFHDLSGSVSLWELLDLYRKFTKKEWCDVNHNIRKLKLKPPQTKKEPRKSKRVQSLEEENKVLTKTVERLQRDVEKWKTKNVELQAKVEELERVIQMLGLESTV